MTTRRAFLVGLLAAGTAPQLSWADAGHPTHLSAAMTPDGAYALAGLRADGSLAFTLPLPARGHAAAAHPFHPEAVAFARRPGTYALVVDCVSGRVLSQITAPEGSHFYGHGAFSEDGNRLYTTENHINSGHGRIGVWSREDGFARIGDMPSGGIGPHEILRVSGTSILAVANGGILTRPETGRQKLNLPTMRPNLTLINEDGVIQDVAELPAELHQNSLRHIAGGLNGIIACAFQWQGDTFGAPALLASYATGAGLRLLDSPEEQIRGLNGYVGSVAVLGNGLIAVTSPRGARLQLFDPERGFISAYIQEDICGVSKTSDAGLATDGLGGVHGIGAETKLFTRHNLAFDNHLVAI